MADSRFCEIANDIYKEHGLLMFALEIVVNKRDSSMMKKSGDILLNPGNYKLPKPFSRNNKYSYYGYIVASDLKDALKVFEKDLLLENKNPNSDNIDLQSFNSEDREIIAADFHRFEGEEEDFVEVENMEAGDWLNLQ